MEIWKDIPRYEGKYQVSDKGRVKSMERVVKCRGGKTKINKEKYLKPREFEGRNYVGLYNGKGVCKRFYINVLMGITFLNHNHDGGNTMVVDHIDNNPMNNVIENLQIISTRMNTSKDKKNTSSKYTGVCWSKKHNKWKSQIQLNGKHLSLGLFVSEKEASEYYENAIVSHEKGEDVKIKRRNTSSKYKGVHFRKSGNRWGAAIRHNNRQVFLGCFINEYDAHLSYENAVKKYRS